MNFGDIRVLSTKQANKFGFHIPASLPLLDDGCSPRPREEIVDRALITSVVVASSYGFKKDDALRWLEQESLTQALSPLEKNFLNGSEENQEIFQVRVETLCAFAWSLSLLPEMDFSKYCPNHLVSLYPDFKKLESADRFRGKAKLRSAQELVEVCDAAYCLHWGLNQSTIDGVKPKRRLSRIVVAERRRALEWILSKEDWDEITLDT